MLTPKYFVGGLYAFEKKTSEETVSDEKVVLELTDKDEGQVEIAFDDRNERVYVRFYLRDLMTALATKV